MHEHFVQTVKEVNEKKSETVAREITETVADQTVPLIQMGGSSKKRKHVDLEEEAVYSADYVFPENELHTPVPNMKNKNWWRGRGKKRQFAGGEERASKKMKMDGFGNNQQQPQNVQRGMKRKRGRGGGNQQQNRTQGPNQQQNRHINQPQNHQQNRGGQQMHQQFQPFDYTSVDYNQFRGGGKSVAGTQKPNTSFKNKVCNFSWFIL